MNSAFNLACGVIGVLVMAIIILSFLLVRGKRKLAETIESNKTLVANIKSQFEQKIKSANEKCSADCTAVKKECSEKIESMKRECEETVRVGKEYIENRREVLAKTPEREILTDVMIALEGYAGRMERLSEALSHEHLHEKLDQLTQSTTAKVDQMSDAVMLHLQRLNIDEKIDQLAQSITDRLNSMDFSSHINDIQNTVDEIKTSIDDKYCYGSTAYSLDSISSDVSSMKSDVESLKSDIQDAKWAADSARDAAESAKSAIESHTF